MYKLTYTTAIVIDGQVAEEIPRELLFDTLRGAYLEAEKEDLWNTSGTEVICYGFKIEELKQENK